MDFGLARQLNKGENIRLTQSGAIMGTPAYMSPEQVNGDIDRIGPASDIYSLGVIFYELLTGRLPFDGSVAAVLGQILMTEPVRPSEFRSDLDLRLEAICTKMMAKQIEDRYASMQEAATALTDFLKNKGEAHGPRPVGNLESFEPVARDKVARKSSKSRRTVPRRQTAIQPPKTFARTRKASGGRKPPVARNRLSALDRIGDIPGWAWGITGAFAALLLVWGVVLLFRVGDQIIRVEIADAVQNDPSLKIYLDGNELKIDGLGDTIELAVGPHDWVVKRGNIIVRGPEKYIVTRGGNEVLKISVDSKLVAKTDTASGGSDAPGGSPPGQQVGPAVPAKDPQTAPRGSATPGRCRCCRHPARSTTPSADG